MARPRIGILGGSFNPPHLGHLLAAVHALKTESLDEVWFVPAYHHAFDKNLAPYRDRLAMCRLLVRRMGSKFRVSAIEKEIECEGKTLLVLKELAKRNPTFRFHLIIGSDLLRQTKRWYRFAEIKKKFGVLVVPRGKGGTFPIPDISSSEIRRRLKSKKNLDELLTPAVARYVRTKRLFH